jgi:hypothetical protein
LNVHRRKRAVLNIVALVVVQSVDWGVLSARAIGWSYSKDSDA